MIRKAIIVVLSFGAVGTGAISSRCYRIQGAKCTFLRLGENATGRICLVGRELHLTYVDCYPFPGTGREGAIATISSNVGGSWGQYGRGITPFGVTSTWVMIRMWILLMVFATYPTIAFIRGPMRRWRRRKLGHCLHCGYDLMGNESGVCPECGTEVE